MRCSSIVTPGSGVTSEPVAIRMVRVASVRSAPSAPVATTRPGAAMRPVPRTRSTLFFLNRKSMPRVLSATALSFQAIIAGRSSVTLSTTTPWRARWPTSANFSDESSSALEGMQPTLRQVPPSVASFSTQATRMPSCAARMAAT